MNTPGQAARGIYFVVVSVFFVCGGVGTRHAVSGPIQHDLWVFYVGRMLSGHVMPCPYLPVRFLGNLLNVIRRTCGAIISEGQVHGLAPHKLIKVCYVS